MNKAQIGIVINYTVFILFMVAMQIGSPDFFSYNSIHPDYLFVFCVLIGYLYGSRDAIIIGLVAGFIKDAYYGRIIGIGMMTCLICSLIATVFLNRFMQKNVLLAMIQVAFATLIYNIIVLGLSYIIFATPVFNNAIWIIVYTIFPAILINLIVGLPIYFAIKKIGPYNMKNMKMLLDNENIEI